MIFSRQCTVHIMLVKFDVPKNQKVYRYCYHVKNSRHILKHGVESTIGVEPLSGVVFAVDFFWSDLS